MKRLRTVTLVFVACCTGVSMHAQITDSTPASSLATPNIVVVSFSTAVLGTVEAQRSFGALEKKYASREQQLQTLNDQIEATRKTLDDPSIKVSDAEKSQKLHELGAKEKQLQRESEDVKSDSQAESQQAFQQVARKVYLFLQEYSQQHGYALVLDRGTEAAPAVWYTAKDVDITDQLVKSYDARSGAAALPDMPKGASPNHP